MLSITKRYWTEIVLHIAFWIGVFYTLLSLSVSHIKMRIDHNGFIMERDVRQTLSPHIFLTLGFLMLLFYGNILLFRRALRYKNILIRIALPVVWFIAIITANYYVGQLLPGQRHDPVVHTLTLNQGKDVPPPPPRVEKDDIMFKQTTAFVFAGSGLSNTILFVFVIVFGLSLAYFFLKEWAAAEKMRSHLEAVQLDTEIKFLKSQINPHFLFNTLNNLFSMAQGRGNDELADGISKLSGMMRYMIYESNEDSVPLKKEIEYLQNCIVLNKLRYADNEAKVVFDYPDKMEGIFIAPMLFIPFVENAFKHGVSIGQSSQIDISISLSNKQLTFNCQNKCYSSIKKMTEEQSGIGLDNVKRRLDLVYPGKHKLLIDNEDGKFNVKLEIDL
ncbi:MAG TPA: sensor histidine kinase [Mucilaginibacter sp.]|jgi:hypothetical protein